MKLKYAYYYSAILKIPTIDTGIQNIYTRYIKLK